MNTKQRKALALIFAKPTAAAVPWRDIEGLFVALGATVSQGRGSRVRVELNGHDAIFHTPHPRPVAEQGRIRDVREFLEKAGITTMSGFTYKGYTGAVEVDTEAERLHGRVLDLDAVLTFVGDTVPEAEQAFRDTVDEYLAWCAERGKNPEKPYSGTLYIRTNPQVHREAAIAAAREGKSLNTWVAEVVAQAAHHAVQPSESKSAGR